MTATNRFSAYLVSKDENGTCHGEVRTDLAPDQLPPGELLIRVEYSSINFKDALSAISNYAGDMGFTEFSFDDNGEVGFDFSEAGIDKNVAREV